MRNANYLFSQVLLYLNEGLFLLVPPTQLGLSHMSYSSTFRPTCLPVRFLYVFDEQGTDSNEFMDCKQHPMATVYELLTFIGCYWSAHILDTICVCWVLSIFVFEHDAAAQFHLCREQDTFLG